MGDQFAEGAVFIFGHCGEGVVVEAHNVSVPVADVVVAEVFCSGFVRDGTEAADSACSLLALAEVESPSVGSRPCEGARCWRETRTTRRLELGHAIPALIEVTGGLEKVARRVVIFALKTAPLRVVTVAEKIT